MTKPQIGDLVESEYGDFFIVTDFLEGDTELVYNPFCKMPVMHGCKETPYVRVNRIIEREGRPFVQAEEVKAAKETA